MSESLEQPKINIEDIQKRANEAAQKAYLSEIDSYYTDYSSAFKKMIKAELEKQEFKYNMELPNILGKLNDALSDEVDRIANNAIAMTYIPMISNALVDIDKEITLTWFLKEVIKELEPDSDTFDEFYFEAEKSNGHDWLNCTLNTPDSHYDFTLHTKSYYGEEKDKHNGKAYQLLSFPTNKQKQGYGSNMVVYKDDVKIEMPFTRNILQDKVLTIFFKMMLSGSTIVVDCNGFDEDMFPEDEHCHC